MITSRRALMLIFLLGATFLIAHTINAVIAEALYVPSGVALPRAVDQDDAVAVLHEGDGGAQPRDIRHGPQLRGDEGGSENDGAAYEHGQA
jgi:hypothetical protein